MDGALNPVTAGVQLALVGMGTVFVFLTLLVGVTALMSRLVLRFAPPAPAPAGDHAHPRLLAVLAAAVHAHRSRVDSLQGQQRRR